MQNSNAKPKTYKVFHESPFVGEHLTPLRFIMIPYGSNYGDVPRNAGHGDKIRFLNGDEAEILSTCLCDMETKLINTLSLMRYGADLDLVRKAWINRAITMGARRSAISETQCLFIWHSKML